jgi:hypothetical protein
MVIRGELFKGGFQQDEFGSRLSSRMTTTLVTEGVRKGIAPYEIALLFTRCRLHFQ